MCGIHLLKLTSDKQVSFVHISYILCMYILNFVCPVSLFPSHHSIWNNLIQLPPVW